MSELDRMTGLRMTKAAVVGTTLRLEVARAPRVRGTRLLRGIGRKTEQQVTAELRTEVGRWTADVPLDELWSLGPQPIDLWVEWTDVGEPVHKRLLADAKVVAEACRRTDLTWSIDDQRGGGSVSIEPPSAAQIVRRSDAFDEDYYRSQVPGLPDDCDLVEHFLSHGAEIGAEPSQMFDTGFYRKRYPDARSMNAFAHYCAYGWRELRDPGPGFSTWWYWSKHMDPAIDTVNPLAHYRRRGRSDRLSVLPAPGPSARLSAGRTLSGGRKPRRVCLFAAYDAEGVLDDYVVDLVRELSRHADVYYLADGDMAASELAKLDGLTLGAWAERHGEYDFGSYSRLVSKVGWEEISSYDELLFVNDSSFLLRPLDDVFAQMDLRACDWWGLQATKGLAATRSSPVNQFRVPRSMDEVRGSLIDFFENDPLYDFHVGSYFLAFRRPVIDDPEFRRYIGSVTVQPSKLLVIRKYEIGLTRWLIQHGHRFDTFVPSLYPFHPIFSRWYFRLLDDGFPLLKRYLLAHNHYRVPELARWKEWISERVEGVDFGPIDRNLARTVDPATLAANLNIGRRPCSEDDEVATHLLTADEFTRLDAKAPKHMNWIAFPATDGSGHLTGSIRAVFEQVKDDPTVRKVVLSRGEWAAEGGVNVVVVPTMSPEGQHALVRCGTILIESSIGNDVVHPVSGRLHNVIHVGGTLPGAALCPGEDGRAFDASTVEQQEYRAIFTSSPVSSTLQTVAHYPMTLHQAWMIGVPRQDLIVAEEGALPAQMRGELQRLRDLVGTRRLVLVSSHDAAGDGFLTDARGRPSSRLLAWLAENENVMLGVWGRGTIRPGVRPEQMVDIRAIGLRTIEMAYRVASVVITDSFHKDVDFLLTGGGLVTFAPEREKAGLLYDPEVFSPTGLCETESDVLTVVDSMLAGGVGSFGELKLRLLFATADGMASARAVERLRNLVIAGGTGRPLGELAS